MRTRHSDLKMLGDGAEAALTHPDNDPLLSDEYPQGFPPCQFSRFTIKFNDSTSFIPAIVCKL